MLCCESHVVFRGEQREHRMILVGLLSDIPVGESVRVQGDVPIAIFNADGVLYAIDDTCTHQDASLSDGWLEGCAVECPLHAACFDLRTGAPSGPPARKPVRTHEVLVVDGRVYVNETVGTAADPAAALVEEVR
jgi:3-phenylpropionate/trans-cinnamate dioxygenase ferredoxin component